ncbi:nucleosome assembly protein 1-like 5 [Phyllostomus discolor]|uniref:Nucleosome assembly protein 1-like 5 n=2 Tax=Phyllostomus discolor TaxID=89673 RepID=A0A7E6DU61_9CHIR|nr:nucleosome assembly protein 1-like 5 [Phyllostomus discolor]
MWAVWRQGIQETGSDVGCEAGETTGEQKQEAGAVRGHGHQLILESQYKAGVERVGPRPTSLPRPTSRPLAASARSLWCSSGAGVSGSRLDLCSFSSTMADSENQAPAEPSQETEAAEVADEAEEVMAEGGAQGGDCDSAAGEPDCAAGQTAEEPQSPAENAPKPKNDFIESLPNSVKCRVLALKKLQKRCDKIEAKFDKEFQALEKKYNEIYKPLLAKIQELTGEMEGCAWTLEGEEEEDDDDEYEDEEEGEEEEEEEEAAAEAAAAKDGGPSSAVSDGAKE